MELAKQIISNDQTVRSDGIQDLKEFNSQSLARNVKKRKQLVPMMLAIKEAFEIMGDVIVELSTENETLKNQICDYDGKWLEESKTRLLKQIDGEKRANLTRSRMQKHIKNTK